MDMQVHLESETILKAEKNVEEERKSKVNGSSAKGCVWSSHGNYKSIKDIWNARGRCLCHFKASVHARFSCCARAWCDLDLVINSDVITLSSSLASSLSLPLILSLSLFLGFLCHLSDQWLPGSGCKSVHCDQCEGKAILLLSTLQLHLGIHPVCWAACTWQLRCDCNSCTTFCMVFLHFALRSVGGLLWLSETLALRSLPRGCWCGSYLPTGFLLWRQSRNEDVVTMPPHDVTSRHVQKKVQRIPNNAGGIWKIYIMETYLFSFVCSSPTNNVFVRTRKCLLCFLSTKDEDKSSAM